MAASPLPALPGNPPPDEWTARKQQFDDLIKSFSSVLGVVTALLAILTAVGFVIVHLYLAQFTRIHGYNLNTSQYIAASVGMVVFFVLLAAPVLIIYYALTAVARKTVQTVVLVMGGVSLVAVIVVLVLPLLQSAPQQAQSNDPGNTLAAIIVGLIVPLLPSFLNSEFYKKRILGLIGTPATPYGSYTTAIKTPAPAQVPTVPAPPTPKPGAMFEPSVFGNLGILSDIYAKGQLPAIPAALTPVPPDNLAAPLTTHTVPRETEPRRPDSFVRPSRPLAALVVLVVLAVSIYLYGRVIYRTIPHYLGGGGVTPISVVFKPDADVARFGLTPSADPRGYSEHLLLLAELTDGILVYDAQTAHAIAIRNDSILGFIDDTPVGPSAT